MKVPLEYIFFLLVPIACIKISRSSLTWLYKAIWINNRQLFGLFHATSSRSCINTYINIMISPKEKKYICKFHTIVQNSNYKKLHIITIKAKKKKYTLFRIPLEVPVSP